MNSFLIPLLFLLNHFPTIYPTEQIPDLMIYNQDTFYILGTLEDEFPLYDILESKKYKNRFNLGVGCEWTGCYRGYIATWEIKNEKIYLKEIKDCCIEKPINLKKIFRRKLKRKKGVKAFWFSGDLNICTHSSIIFYILEEDIKFINFKIKKGKIKKTIVN